LFLTAYAVLVGLLVGSFVNLAADRVPRGESLIRPGSHCRACGRRLNVVDLLPVFGYLLLRGRCATCRTPIGVSAPVIEAVSGLLMLGAIVWLGLWPGVLVGIGLIALWGGAAIGLAMKRKAAEGSS
jgi:prepilin signal peptidase PulO-like enzyme (type II secretory pathway)